MEQLAPRNSLVTGRRGEFDQFMIRPQLYEIAKIDFKAIEKHKFLKGRTYKLELVIITIFTGS